MTESKDYVRAVKKRFIDEYATKEPFNRYINGCGITRVLMSKERYTLENASSLDALAVSLVKPIPLNIKCELPDYYEGIPVVYGMLE